MPKRTSKNAKIKRCPFCDNKAYLECGDDPKGRNGWRVRCSSLPCQAEIWAYTWEPAVDKWNKRKVNEKDLKGWKLAAETWKESYNKLTKYIADRAYVESNRNDDSL